jgi:hypothetical protein
LLRVIRFRSIQKGGRRQGSDGGEGDAREVTFFVGLKGERWWRRRRRK